MSTHDGGKPQVKPLRYAEPKGPSNQHRNAVGLGGSVSHCGSQGSYSEHDGSSGSPGIGGSRHPKGSQK